MDADEEDDEDEEGEEGEEGEDVVFTCDLNLRASCSSAVENS